MDQNKLKSYAQEARRDFIAAVTERAAFYGLTAKNIEPIVEQGDVVLIGTRAFSRDVAMKRKGLEDRIRRDGFEQMIEAMAYTWFNRFAAIRFMELHGYLNHGYRVLSHTDDQEQPEVLEHAADIDLPGLDRERAVELKLDGTKDEELYRLLLLAQCNALHRAMPFLFERIGDETELLLPANLLHSDSLVRNLVGNVDEGAWREIEVIGWLYQFYISEKKDQVIGKVVKSEDIPAATQLFTPNWIVKYMVQNSLGAQWLATYPQSPLKAQMEYYIEPAEQSEDVQTQIKAITPNSLNPEELTLLDPACGSGHILVEAYELFKAIYLERGYRQRDIATLILEKNLFGFDIDERAAQLTGFALMMMGRADDRRLFEREVKLNVVALKSSRAFDLETLVVNVDLAGYGLQRDDLLKLKGLFENAETLGSLIQVPEQLKTKFGKLRKLAAQESQDLFVTETLCTIEVLIVQSEYLARRYDAVVANPPYMGSKAMGGLLKRFAKECFPKTKSDLFAISAERFLDFAKPSGFVGLMTPFTWMFLKSYEALREILVETKTLQSLIQPEYHAFFDSAYVPVCTFVCQCKHMSGFDASFIKLSDFYGADVQATRTLEAIRNPECGWLYNAKPDQFTMIPGRPIAYWVSQDIRSAFATLPALKSVAPTKQGLATGDNSRFLRFWTEVPFKRARLCDENRYSCKTRPRWFACNKGGEFRKWYGNNDYVVNWENDGEEIKGFVDDQGKLRSRPQNLSYYFREGLTWSAISSSSLSMRYSPAYHMFETKGAMCFPNDSHAMFAVLAFANSKLVNRFLSATSPTLDFHEGPVGNLPFKQVSSSIPGAKASVRIAKEDWDAFERSWDFERNPLLGPDHVLESSYESWTKQNKATIVEMTNLEEDNNRLFIDSYSLQNELTPNVPIQEISLTINPAYRYSGKLNEKEQQERFLRDTMQELISYSMGCMMGRYSLDEPGLIYAHGGNEEFDAARYTTFSADSDGIIPISAIEWFDDDAAGRFSEFLSAALDKEHLEKNLAFVADNLAPRKKESSRETIRRYLCDGFFKDHLQTYKNRPIYWLFSSGKAKAFQCLVYLHRYNEGTLARMRTEYVVPLQGMMASRVRHLEGDTAAATSTTHRRRLDKERAILVKQQAELLEFDEKLRHYADQRINLDLDDGVKVNYGKFGDLLAEVKKVTGGKAG